MAHSFSTNQTPATGSIAMYLFLSTLVTAGWTKVKDSDGTTYSSSGAQITGGATGAHGLDNNNSWFVLKAPAVNAQQRSFCFQRGTSNLNWRVKYSYTAGFTGGSPAATQTPSATDEQILYGGGTDASPTFQAMFAADGSYTFNVCAGDTTVGYSFYWMAWLSGNLNSNGRVMLMDVLSSGSYSSSDVDPAFIHRGTVTGASAILSGNEIGHQGVINGWAYYKNGGIPTWLGTILMNVADTIVTGISIAGSGGPGYGGSTYGLSANSWDGNDDGFPTMYGRTKSPGTANGFKGCGMMMRMMTVLRAAGDTLSLDGGTKNYIYVNGQALPWDGSTPIL